MDGGFRSVAEQNSEDGAAEAEAEGFRENQTHDEVFRGAEGFQNADLAGSLQDRHVHGERNHCEADYDADSQHYIEERSEHGDIVDRKEGLEFRHGENGIVVVLCFEVRDHLIHMGRVIEFQEHLADVTGGADHVLQDGHLNEEVSEFTGFDDAGDMPVVPGKPKRTPGPDVALIGVPGIDQDVVRALERMPSSKTKPAAHFIERRRVDADQGVEASDGIHYSAHRLSDVWFGSEGLTIFVGMVAVLKLMTLEFGGLNRISAPTPANVFGNRL